MFRSRLFYGLLACAMMLVLPERGQSQTVESSIIGAWTFGGRSCEKSFTARRGKLVRKAGAGDEPTGVIFSSSKFDGGEHDCKIQRIGQTGNDISVSLRCTEMDKSYTNIDRYRMSDRTSIVYIGSSNARSGNGAYPPGTRLQRCDP